MCVCVCVLGGGGGGGGGVAVTRFETTCLFESHDSPSDASEFLKSVKPSKQAQVTTDPGMSLSLMSTLGQHFVAVSQRSITVLLGPNKVPSIGRLRCTITEVYYCTIGAQQGAQYREVPLYYHRGLLLYYWGPTRCPV